MGGRAGGPHVSARPSPQTLKSNNARLTAALQDSATNVEEWKTQLVHWKDECTRLRKRVQDAEASARDASDTRASAVRA